MHIRTRIFLTLLAMAAAPNAWAQAFPTTPVRIIVAFPAGGGTDIVARTISPRLSEYFGQQVVIDNRGGAGGVVGTEIAAKAPADGYTIFMGTLGNLSVNPLLYKNLPFDIHRDFAPLTQVVSVNFMLVIHPSFPVKTVTDLINIAKSKPGQINYASSGKAVRPTSPPSFSTPWQR